MKNIYILPTDQPSRIFFNDGDLCLRNSMSFKEGDKPQHIYITSDTEDINENDYIITKDGRLVQASYLLSNDVQFGSKIILTTNPDLIKDGVQAIDYKFLEWFVKNPSCEYVEIEDWYNPILSCCPSKERCHCNKKRIIIPE